MAKESGFHLSKWYMDVVDPQGNCFIGYYAALRWKGISVHYHHRLYSAGQGKIKSKGGFSRRAIPAWQDDELHWKTKEVSGCWKTDATAVSERLYDAADGYIQWNCHQPRAKAIVKTDDRIFKGYGYTEHLEMTLPPWKLPIDELRWGRFLSENHSVTWINWRGLHPKTLLVHNGQKTAQLSFPENEISGSGLTIQHLTSQELRSGTLLSTVFKNFGAAKKLFPVRALRTHEQKYCSGSKLILSPAETETGFSIHEIVHWL